MINPTEATGKIRPILIWPNAEKLHESSIDITEFNEELQQLGKDLLVTMKAENGIGLSAPQVGVLKNVIAIWIDETQPYVFVNPKIATASVDLFKVKEGCLSVPGYFEDRERPRHITLEFFDTVGVKHEVAFSDLSAFCIQHEIDHLNGKLFIDHSSELKRDRIKARIKKVTKSKGK